MTEFKAKCGDCGHVFTVIQLPARLDVAAFAMGKAVCTKCESKRLFVATGVEA